MDLALSYSARDRSSLAEDLKVLKEGCNANFATIHDAGQRLVSTESTALLVAIKSCISQDNTLGIALLLAIQADVLPECCSSQFFEVSRQFLCAADRLQARIAVNEVVTICRKIYSLCLTIGRPRSSIRILSLAVDVVSPGSFVLTPVHALVVQACFHGQIFSVGIDFLDSHTVFEVDPKATALQDSDYLHFFYYGALCYAAHKKYQSALDFLLPILCIPATTMHGLIAAAYKKCLLLAILATGNRFSRPKNCSLAVSKYADQLNPETCIQQRLVNTYFQSSYEILAQYIAASGEELRAATKWNGIAATDWDLACDLLQCMEFRKLQLISQTFSAQTLSQLQRCLYPSTSTLADGTAVVSDASSSAIGPISARAHIFSDVDLVVENNGEDGLSPRQRLLNRIEQLLNYGDGSLFASINCSDDVIVFGNRRGYDGNVLQMHDNKVTDALTDQLQGHIQQCVALSARVKELHTEAITSSVTMKPTSMSSKSAQLLASML